MTVRKANKSDETILLSMLNYNIFDMSITAENFHKMYDKYYTDCNIIIHNNIRIGMIFNKHIFINPLYWERIGIDELNLLLEDKM